MGNAYIANSAQLILNLLGYKEMIVGNVLCITVSTALNDIPDTRKKKVMHSNKENAVHSAGVWGRDDWLFS